MYLADDVVVHVLNKTSSTAIWTKLKKMYITKSLINALTLKAVLPTTNERGTKHARACKQLSEVLTNLLSIGKKVKKTRIPILLSSLSPFFESLVTALPIEKYHQDGRSHYSTTPE